MKHNINSSRVALALVLASVSPGATAGIVAYDNFGPGDSYAAGGWTVEQFDPWLDFWSSVAAPFTAGASGPLQSLTVAAVNRDSVNLVLVEDDSGMPGTSILEMFSSNGALPGGLFTMTSILQPQLTLGAKYWLEMSPDQFGTGLWYWNNQGVLGLGLMSGGILTPWDVSSDSWAITPALRVEVVPEPSGWAAMAGVGLLGFAAYRKTRG